MAHLPPVARNVAATQADVDAACDRLGDRLLAGCPQAIERRVGGWWRATPPPSR